MVRFFDFHAGTKVLILENIIYGVDDLNVVDVLATKGSIGIVLTYEDYCEHVFDGRDRDSNSFNFAWVKSRIECGTHCPVRLEVVPPLSDETYDYYKTNEICVSLTCKVGAIVLLPAYSFKAIESSS